jgi:hypothetical protein
MVESEKTKNLGEQEDLNHRTSTVPPRSRDTIFICYCTRLKLLHNDQIHVIVVGKALEEPTNVAAHVQADTIPEAIRPGLTLREAELNSSESLGEKPVYLVWMYVSPSTNTLNRTQIPAGQALSGLLIPG